MNKTLDYICLQPTRQGQASYAHVNEIVAGLRRRGWTVRLVEPPLPRPGRADGLRRLVAAATTQLGYWLRCRFRPARYVYIRSHFLTVPTAILAWLAGSIVVQEVNGPGTDTFDAWPQLRRLSGLLAMTSRVQIRLADAIVLVTPGLESPVRRRTRRRTGFHVIGNGANTDLFVPSEDGPAEDPRPYAVFVGALASWQGVDTILDAVRRPAWPDGVDLVIAGDGIEGARVAAEAAVNPRVRWLRTIPYTEAPALVARSLVALVPMADVPRSRYGLSPLKLYEAMACGVPVVASDLPGLGDTVRMHDCGRTFPASDADGLAAAVAQLAADRAAAREMGMRGRAAAVEHYSWDIRAEQTQRMLLSIGDTGSRTVRPRGRRVPPASPGT